jgi:hypothetical protein
MENSGPALLLIHVMTIALQVGLGIVAPALIFLASLLIARQTRLWVGAFLIVGAAIMLLSSILSSIPVFQVYPSEIPAPQLLWIMVARGLGSLLFATGFLGLALKKRAPLAAGTVRVPPHDPPVQAPGSASD